MRTSNQLRHALSVAFSLACGFGFEPPSYAQSVVPSGGTVVGGAATIQQNGANQVINQSTDKAIINWQDFSIGAGNSVRINQLSASSILLNRVVGSNPSSIFGNLSSNGQVFLVNPFGVFFGAGASVDVGGLVATTMNIRNEDFMSGNYVFNRSNALPARQEVINQGVIKARENGYVVLAGDYAANRGIVEARLGTAAIASGGKMTLDIQGDSLINFAVNEKTVAALSGVDNSGHILVDGGRAIMTASVASDLTTAVVNNTGVIRASTTVEREGAIYLSAEGGNTLVSGTLDVSGNAAGQKGGTIQVLGERVALVDNAVVIASGSAGGGKINIGGNYQGSGPLKNATSTYVGKDVQIKADAIATGNGGDVVVWANDQTRYYGSISARGGANGGNGGNVEVSGKQWLDFQGNVNTLAVNGLAGTLLLDPTDIEILGSIGATPDMTGTSPFEDASNNGGTSQMTVGALETALQNGNVIVRTTSSGTAPLGGTITIDDGGGGGVQWTAGNSLTLQADNNIVVKSAVESTGGGGITMNATNGITTTGVVRTQSGALQMNANTIVTGADVTSNGGTITLDSGSSVTNNAAISSNGGTVVLDGNQININANVSAGSGSVLLNANGAVQKAGSTISANKLLLTGSGNWSLSGVNNGNVGSWNDINILAATISGGTIDFSNNKNLSVGSVTDAGGVTHNGIAHNGNTRLYLDRNNGAVSLAQKINSSNLYIRAQGGVTQQAGADITANSLALLGGAATLTNAGNNVGTLAASINGALNYRDANTLTIGTATGVAGITTNNNSVNIFTGNSNAYLSNNADGSPNTSNANGLASLTLNESINAGSGAVQLSVGKGGIYQRSDTASGAALPNGSIKAGSLLLYDGSNGEVVPFNLNNGSNSVGTLAAITNGGVSYAGSALTIGSLTATNGTVVSGITTTANKLIQTKTIVDPITNATTTENIYNDNGVSFSIGGNLNINQNINAAGGTVQIGISGDSVVRTATGKRINANALGIYGDNGKGEFYLTTNVAGIGAGGGAKMVVDNSSYTGELTGLPIGAEATEGGTYVPPPNDDGSVNPSVTVEKSGATAVGDFYLTTGGALKLSKLVSTGDNLLLRSTSLEILLQAQTKNGARIMLQPFNLAGNLGINNSALTDPDSVPGGKEAGTNFVAETNYSARTLLKFSNPTATFFFGTAQNEILNDSKVDAAAKNIFTGTIHMGYDDVYNKATANAAKQIDDAEFNLGYRSISAQTTGDLLAYSVGPVYNLRLAANNLTINGFKSVGPQIHLFSNNLQLPGTTADYVNPNSPEITLRTLNSETLWIGEGLVSKPWEPHIRPQTLAKLPDSSTIIISGSTDFPFPNGGPGNGDIHVKWDSGAVDLGNRKLVMSTGKTIYYYAYKNFTAKNDGGTSGGLWKGCSNITVCKQESPSPFEQPSDDDGSTGGGGTGTGTPPYTGNCAGCPPAPTNTNPYPPDTTTPTQGTQDGSDSDNNNNNGNPGNNTGQVGDGGGDGNGNDNGSGDGGAGSGSGGDGNGNGDGSGDGSGNGNGNGSGDGSGGDGSGDGGAGNGSGGDGNGDGNGGSGSGGNGNGDGSGDGSGNGNGNGSGDGSGGDGSGDGGAGNGSGGDGNGDGNGSSGSGGNGNGDGSGNDGSGNGNGDGNGGSGSGGNGSGDDGSGNGNGDGNGGNGSGSDGNGDGDGGAGNSSGGNGNGNDSGDGNGDGSNGDGDGGAGNGSGGSGDDDGSSGGSGNGDGTSSGDASGGNGSGGNGDGSGNGNGDGDGGPGSGGDGNGSGDGGAGNGSGGTGTGNGAGSGDGTDNGAGGNGDGGNGAGDGGDGEDSGDGGSANGSGGDSDGSGDGSDFLTPSFNISCDDATQATKRKEKTDQQGQKKLIEVKQDGVKLRDPCQQQQQPGKGDKK